MSEVTALPKCRPPNLESRVLTKGPLHLSNNKKTTTTIKILLVSYLGHNTIGSSANITQARRIKIICQTYHPKSQW